MAVSSSVGWTSQDEPNINLTIASTPGNNGGAPGHYLSAWTTTAEAPDPLRDYRCGLVVQLLGWWIRTTVPQCVVPRFDTACAGVSRSLAAR